MSNEPFAPFQPTTPAPAAPAAAPAKRTRGPRRASAEPAKSKTERKKRGPNKTKTASRGKAKSSVRVDLRIALLIGGVLKPEDQALFSMLVAGLSGASKASRTRVLEAIEKVFE